ncbi:MAG: exodeoxyribonuclease III, partial [Pseudomonadales bacterium]
MKIVSFNVNSIRARLHQLEAVIEKHQPDFIGLQETKVVDDDFPEETINQLGYQVAFHGQKTHYGVALLYKAEPSALLKGFPHDTDEAQKRFIAGTFPTSDQRQLTVINGYFPQGENRKHPTKFPNKEKFYADLNDHIQANHSGSDDLLLVVGDMNIAPVDADIGIGDDNRKRWLKEGKTCFLPEEREWMGKLIGLGMTDVYRHHYPDVDDLFSWFDYRSKGFEKEPKRGLRIDLVLASNAALKQSLDSGIDYDIRAMDKPSD